VRTCLTLHWWLFWQPVSAHAFEGSEAWASDDEDCLERCQDSHALRVQPESSILSSSMQERTDTTQQLLNTAPVWTSSQCAEGVQGGAASFKPEHTVLCTAFRLSCKLSTWCCSMHAACFVTHMQ
jgi:hypothetical protein